MGYAGNEGTLDSDYLGSIGNRTRTPPQNVSAFMFGASTPTPYADFSQALDPVTSYGQGSDSGAYTVRAGDTLQSIAAGLWGDSSLWYKLAEANGLSGGGAIGEGRTLTIPANVIASEHNASTFKPYDAARALGDLSPTNPKPSKHGGCGMMGAVLMIAIAVAVTAITAGAAVAALTPGLTLLGGISTFAAGSASLGTMVAAGAIGGALGSIASQGFGVAIGQQSKFDWKGVAMGALSGAISAGVAKFGALAQVGKLGNKLGALSRIGNLLHGGGFLGGAARGLVGSALSQGIGVATGLQDKFDFAGVAGAALAGGVTGALGGDVPSLAGHVSLEGIAANASLSAVGAFANAAARTLINGSDFGDNLIAALPDVIGSTIGNLIAGGVQEGRSVDLADANGPIYPGGDSYDGDGMMEEWEDNNHVGATAYQGDGIVEAWESAGSPPELTDSGLSHQVDILGDEKAYQLGAADLDPNIEFALAHGFIGAAAQRVPGEEDGIPRFSVREMFENLFRHAETSRQTVVDRVRDFIPDLTCRSLTSGEIQMARPVFGPVIDYSVVEVCRGNATNPAAAAAFFKGNPAITIGNRIYVRSSTRFNRYVDDYSHAIPEFQSLFIHEMTHVFQYRMLGGVAAFSLRYSAELAMVRGHPDRMYEYQQGVTPFGSAMLEAQAQMVGDRWRAVVEHDTAAIRRLDRNLETAPWPIMNTRRW